MLRGNETQKDKHVCGPYAEAPGAGAESQRQKAEWWARPGGVRTGVVVEWGQFLFCRDERAQTDGGNGYTAL